MDYYKFFMKGALELAKKTLSRGEFPVGCVVVYENRIILTGCRSGTVGNSGNEVDHAEMIALRKLAAIKQDIDRKKVVIFSTLEPCLMCFGAILLSGVGGLVYAYEDVMGGATMCDLSLLAPLYRNNDLFIIPNILRTESLQLFKTFFSNPDNLYLKGSLLAKYSLSQPDPESANST